MKCKIDLNDPNFVYFLGIIWGDGYITKRHGYAGLEITSTDFNYIKPIIKSFCDIKIKTRHRNKELNYKKQSIINICNKELGSLLLDCDYRNKSFNNPNKILNLISADLQHYWLRGYFDADGCFYYNKKNKGKEVSIYSTYEQDWSLLSNWFQSLNIKHTIQLRKRSNGGSSCIRFGSTKSVINFGNYIYQGQQFGYKRKYKKWLTMIN